MSTRPSILREIYADKRVKVERQKDTADIPELERTARSISESSQKFRLSSALSDRSRINVIAEFKRASPSKGIIDGTASPEEKALEYVEKGATAVSVLTEESYFLGSAEDLKAVRNAVPVPVLRKDFVFDPFQIIETRAIGADAVLLIAAMLDDPELRKLMEEAEALGLDALVEVHSKGEFERAVTAGARLIGVNNRDLNTFEVSLKHSKDLIGYKPEDVVMISESGISTVDEIEELKALGFDGFLIGEALMKGTPLLSLGTKIPN